MGAKFIVAVSLVIGRDGTVLLVRRSPGKDHAPSDWESVSGRVESGETPVETARREAFEETGLSINVLEPLDTFHFYRGDTREEAIGITFHCRWLEGEVRLSEEHTAFAWVSRDQVRNYKLPLELLRCIDNVLDDACVRRSAP